VVKETNANTGNITDYLYGDDLIKQTQAANDSYYLYDGLGSTRVLTDSAGNVTDTYDYESFGTLLNQTGATPNDYLFTGEQYDGNLDNYYLRARYYDQSIGRFPQMDTYHGRMGEPATLHKYLYTHADPVNGTDPTGLFNIAEVNATTSIVGIQSVGTVGRVGVIGFAANDAAIAGGAGLSSTQTGLLVIASMGAAGAKLFDLLSDKEDDGTEETVSVYHGSFNAGSVRHHGLRLDDGTMFVSRDINASLDAIGPHRSDIQNASDPGVITSEIPELQFNALMLPFERSYNGFYPYLIKSTEIPLRSTIQIELFNRHIVF
jgi:RHS repeat-associated protein